MKRLRRPRAHAQQQRPTPQGQPPAPADLATGAPAGWPAPAPVGLQRQWLLVEALVEAPELQAPEALALARQPEPPWAHGWKAQPSPHAPALAQGQRQRLKGQQRWRQAAPTQQPSSVAGEARPVLSPSAPPAWAPAEAPQTPRFAADQPQLLLLPQAAKGASAAPRPRPGVSWPVGAQVLRAEAGVATQLLRPWPQLPAPAGWGRAAQLRKPLWQPGRLLWGS